MRPSREAIADARSAAAEPPIRSPWTPSAIALLGTLPDPAIAARLGVSAYAVKAERKRRGIPAVQGGRRPDRGEAASVHRTVKLTRDEAAADDAARGELSWTEWDRRARAAAREAAAPIGLDHSRNPDCGRVGCPGGAHHAHDADLEPTT